MPDVNGPRLRCLRNARGWTQQRLADKSGLCKRAIERAEHGGPSSLDTISRIADALDCDDNELLAATELSSLEPNRIADQQLFRAPNSERDLLQEFALRDILVLKFSRRNDVRSSETRTTAYQRHDTDVHEALGCAAARMLASLLRPADVIGVGGGRAPKCCVHYLANCGEIPECQVVSLCGNVSSRVDQTNSKSPHDEYTDADVIAGILGTRLPGNDVSLVKSPLAGRRNPKRPQRRCPNGRKARLALIGLGVLTDSHPLAQYQRNPDLVEITEDLEKLFGIIHDADHNSSASSKPVIGDICNFLFRVRPSTPLPVIDKLIERINRRTTTLAVDGLAKICQRGAAVLVAGGPEKACVIRHVLKQSPNWISHLVTDESAAAKLLSDDCS